MSSLIFLAVAYAVVWLVLFAYLARLGGSIRGLERQVAELRASLRPDDGPRTEDHGWTG